MAPRCICSRMNDDAWTRLQCATNVSQWEVLLQLNTNCNLLNENIVLTKKLIAANQELQKLKLKQTNYKIQIASLLRCIEKIKNKQI